MKVGIPKEVKNHEYRVAITPSGVHELVRAGHRGVRASGTRAPARRSPTRTSSPRGRPSCPAPDEVWETGELILKVKEPIAEEYPRLRKDQVLFTYLHLAADRAVHRRPAGVGHHRHRLRDRAGCPTARCRCSRPCPRWPAGWRRRSARTTCRRDGGGRGVLMGGVSGVYAAKVVVLGAGVSGMNAAAIALGMQAEVLLVDKNIARLRAADAIYQGHCQTVASNAYEIERAVIDADLVIGAVLVPGAKAPMLISNELVSRMKPGSVLVDISIDQGGCFEDSHPTTHADPTYRVHDSVFYCVANMPGAVPHTSTYALTNVTLPYVLEIANLGWREALQADPALAGGLNTHEGALTCEPVAEAHGLPWTETGQIIR